MASITIDQGIEQAGFGRFQKKIMAICGLVWASDGIKVLLIAFVLPAISQEWSLSNAQKGLLGTAIFLGMLAGAWIWGRLSDLIGRKQVFIITILIDTVFGLASAFAPSFAWLVALRVLTGFGVGGTLPVDYSIFAEFLPTQKRGRYLVLLESFWALGSVLAAGLAWLLVPSLGWRWLVAASAVPGILVFFIWRYVPESPRYLLVKGKNNEALQILRQVARENGNQLLATKLTQLKNMKTRVTDLMKPGLRSTTILLWVIWFGISLGYYGVFTWMPNFFKSQGMAMLPVYQNSFILALAQIPGYLSAAYLVERWGRRKTLGFYLIAGGAFTYLFAVSGTLNSLIGMGILMSFFSLGAWGALYAYTPEAYPTNLRGTGMGTASGWTRISGAIAPTLGGLLMTSSIVLPLTVFALAYIVAGAAAFMLTRETSQRPLEDMLAG
jgi:MFS transporter, putative metabolite:H+ symporter